MTSDAPICICGKYGEGLIGTPPAYLIGHYTCPGAARGIKITVAIYIFHSMDTKVAVAKTPIPE
jgi:hypothetical protein